MHKSKLKQISLAVCLALMPIYSFAAGLGKLNVNSGLGEPLKAEIELLSLTSDELASLSASVAPEEAYAVQGIPRLGIHNNIRVELTKGADGSPILKLSSLQPVSDPYLDMLIQVDWSSGRLLREYTILLDPPEYKQAIKDVNTAPSIINKPVATASKSTYSAPSQTSQSDSPANQQGTSKSKKSKRATEKLIDTEAGAELATDATSTQVTTQRGDSLGAIAKEVAVDGVSLDQMLLGLYEANKQAFVDGNMNRLKVGQILKVPSKDILMETGSKQANKEVKLHAANWNAYRNSLAGNVVASEVAEQNTVKQSASGKISTAEDLAAINKAGPQDVVKLSAGGKDAKAGSGTDAKVLALQEEATAKEKALKEAQERTSVLEAQIRDMQKLLALKNQAMANAQKSAELQAAAVPATKPLDVKSELPKQESAKPEEAKPVEVKVAEVAPSAPIVADAQPAMPAESTPTNASPSEVNTKPVDANNASVSSKAKPPAPVAAVVPEEEPSLLDSIFAAVDMMMLAAAAGVLLLAAGWAYLRNKRRRDLDSFERGILTSGGLSANTVFGNTTGNASTSDTSFLTDFAQSADGSMIDTNDVDPIAEAEVYMAYGRDAQAEEILKDALVKEPKRYELHLKLLEMYASRKDISAFEAIAGELYTTLGSDNPTWAKVAELGATVEPDNPLYDLSRLPVMTAESVSNDGENISANVDIDKELDWEKELDLDKELEFSTGFSEITKESPVVNQTATVDSENSAIEEVVAFRTLNTADAGRDEAISASQEQFDDEFKHDLNDEMALFGDVEALPEPVSADQVSDNAEKSSLALEVGTDNSLNFDLTELGNFALDNPTVDATDQVKAQSANAPEFSYDLELPQMTPDNAAQASFNDEAAALSSSVLPESNSAALDFNFEGLNQEAALTPANAAAITSFTDADFDLDVSQQHTTALKKENLAQEKLEIPALADIDLSFGDAKMQATDQTEEIKYDFPIVDEDVATISASGSALEPVASNNFDFSSISLDLSDASANTSATATIKTTEVLSSPEDLAVSDAALVQAATITSVEAIENPDVDIKLDLVKVYIDMEDVEGARELLDEVVKEGGPQQRKKAEQLLASLA